MTFIKKPNLRVGLHYSGAVGRLVNSLQPRQAVGRGQALLLIAQVAYRVVQSFTKSNCSGPERGATACQSITLVNAEL